MYGWPTAYEGSATLLRSKAIMQLPNPSRITASWSEQNLWSVVNAQM